jgi:hypothetical protein
VFNDCHAFGIKIIDRSHVSPAAIRILSAKYIRSSCWMKTLGDIENASPAFESSEWFFRCCFFIMQAGAAIFVRLERGRDPFRVGGWVL